MQTILHILRLAGSYKPDLHVRIENPPYLPLVIEATPEPGPQCLPGLSVAHYGDLDSDLMRDPEMVFELTGEAFHLALDPFYWRNDYLGVEQYSRSLKRGKYVVLPRLYEQHRGFALDWDRVLSMQGFLAAFQRGGVKP